MDNLDKET